MQNSPITKLKGTEVCDLDGNEVTISVLKKMSYEKTQKDNSMKSFKKKNDKKRFFQRDINHKKEQNRFWS